MAAIALDWRDFMLGKDPEFPHENQDAWRIDAPRGVAAMADGVSASIFCRRWARILTDAAVEDPPDPEDSAALAGWLARQRQTWAASIDASRLTWYQRPKLREGAFSTLLWVRFLPEETTPPPATESGPPGPESWRVRLRAHAVGDTCLFLVRTGEVVCRFPIARAGDFEDAPLAIGSVDLGRDSLLKFEVLEETCWPGDLIVLCTDALAEWALRREESGRPPAWEDYWNLPEEAWQNEIAALRAGREIRHDDTTLLLIRIEGHRRTATSSTKTSAATTNSQ